jgi:hypothetical protein
MVATAGYNITAPTQSASENMGLGDTVWFGTSCWQFVQASGAISKGGLVTVSKDGVAVAATTSTVTNTTGQSIAKLGGVAQFAFADGDKGLLLVGPFDVSPIDGSAFTVLAATGDVQSSLQYTTATAGVVSNTVTTKVQNLALTADASGTGPVLTACRALDRITFGS